ncbi:hypothetical protein EVAR_95518_1 [Eumeta japonica]|uniref:Uncharacterized protein n=1 Tax=Eumeta variegata TaxID=151549 RepID=A0A4C1UJS0_EUMVA|nr:hypothetical protein EVAR_95518_1 [Eumeta japonica]
MTGHQLSTITSIYLPPSKALLGEQEQKLKTEQITLLKDVSLSVQSIEVHDDQLNSDHCPIVLQLDTSYRSQISKKITN